MDPKDVSAAVPTAPPESAISKNSGGLPAWAITLVFAGAAVVVGAVILYLTKASRRRWR